MKQRLMISLSAGTLFILFLVAGDWWYTSFIFLLAVLAYREFARMNNVSYNPASSLMTRIAFLIGTLLIGAIFVLQLAHQNILALNFEIYDSDHIIFGLLLYFVFIVLNKNQVNVAKVSYLFVGALYIGSGFAYMMSIIWQESGFALSLLILAITWASDSGAYIIGRRWGEHHLWPDVSPGKTFEGSIAGLFFGAGASTLIFLFIPKLHGVLDFNPVFLGVFISACGQMGDLIESAIKRTADVKDSGRILPGHGGIFDRFDSLIFTFIMLHIIRII